MHKSIHTRGLVDNKNFYFSTQQFMYPTIISNISNSVNELSIKSLACLTIIMYISPSKNTVVSYVPLAVI